MRQELSSSKDCYSNKCGGIEIVQIAGNYLAEPWCREQGSPRPDVSDSVRPCMRPSRPAPPSGREQSTDASPRRTTLRDIAQETGLAVSTVSMAMRGDHSIAAGTRQIVEEVAARLNYQPHPMLSALMQSRSVGRELPRQLPIALLSLHSKPSPWNYGWIIPDLYKGLLGRCESRGYRLEEFWMQEPGMSQRRVDEILIARGIGGVIVGPSPVHQSKVRLSWERFSAVAIGYSISQPVLDRVISHHIHGVQIALRELRRRGYKRIGLAMLARENARVDWQWTAGYFGGGLQQKLTLCPPFLAPPAQWKGARFLKWYRTHCPEAVLCVHPEEVLPWLEAAGVRVPEDLAVVDLYYRDQFGDQFAAINQNVLQIGQSTVDLLVDKIHQNRRGVPSVPRTLLVEPQWRDGRSVC